MKNKLEEKIELLEIFEDLDTHLFEMQKTIDGLTKDLNVMYKIVCTDPKKKSIKYPHFPVSDYHKKELRIKV